MPADSSAPARRQRETAAARPARRLLVACALLSLAYGAVGAFVLDAGRQERLLWDLDYYRTAAARWHAGLDPYLDDDGRPTGYFYAPSLTPLLSRLFHGVEAEALYGLLTALGLAAALALSMRAMRPATGERRLAWLYALAFGNAEVLYALATGNLAWLSGLLLAAALAAAARARWPVFYLLVGVASLFKPYALVLLLVPFVLGALSLRAGLALLPLAVDGLLGRLLWPGLAASRAEAVWAAVVEPLQLRASLAGRLSRFLARQLDVDVALATLIAVVAQLAVALGVAWVLRARRSGGQTVSLAWAAVAGFAAIPRMAGYDAFVFGPVVFAAFGPAAGESQRHRAGWAVLVALFAGLLKEGLALLPILALVAVLARPGWPRPEGPAGGLERI